MTGALPPAVRRFCVSSGESALAAAWSAVHFHVGPDEEVILCHHLVPLMLDELDSGAIDSFFFVRYWEGGKHLRLRFLGGAAGSRHVFERVRRIDAARRGGSATPQRVLEARYEPEVERYGGVDRIGICEDHFMLSSFNVWTNLRPNLHLEATELMSRVRLPCAARDMMVILGSAYDRSALAIRFLQAYRASWLLPKRGGEMARTEALVQRLEREMETPFHCLDRRVKDHLLGSWNDQRNGGGGPAVSAGSAGELDRRQWAAGNAALLGALRASGLEFTSPRGVRALSGIIHMNNNRYGVLNRDEAFLAFLCERTLLEAPA